LIFGYLARRPELLTGVDSGFFRSEQARAVLGMTGYGAAGVVAFFTPVAVPLVVLLALPAFYYVTSHGLTGLPARRRPR